MSPEGTTQPNGGAGSTRDHTALGKGATRAPFSAADPMQGGFSPISDPRAGDYVGAGKVSGLGDAYSPPTEIQLGPVQDAGNGFFFRGRDRRGYFLLIFNTPQRGELLEFSLTVPGDDEGKTTTTLPLRFERPLPFLQADRTVSRSNSTNGAVEVSLTRISESEWELRAAARPQHPAPKYAISQLDARIFIETAAEDTATWKRFDVSFQGRLSQAPGKFSGRLSFERKDPKE